MDAKEDLNLGDIVPFSSRNFGTSYVRCMDIRYGIIVAFTCNDNPRVVPLYFKTKQTLTAKGAFDWMRKFSVIIPNSMKLSEQQKQMFLSGGSRLENYNNIMSAAMQDIRKRTAPVVRYKGTTSYFTFD